MMTLNSSMMKWNTQHQQQQHTLNVARPDEVNVLRRSCRRRFLDNTPLLPIVVIVMVLSSSNYSLLAWRPSSSRLGRVSMKPLCSNSFIGSTAELTSAASSSSSCNHNHNLKSFLFMRKQKASDQRTRRRQQSGGIDITDYYNTMQDVGLSPTPSKMTMTSSATLVTRSPMDNATWKNKKYLGGGNNSLLTTTPSSSSSGGGRGRSRKRSNLYTSLAYYHQYFLKYLTAEYQAEEEEVLGRIKTSLDDGSPLGLEIAGYALFDMYIERRGNLFGDEVYRMTKASDATTTYQRDDDIDDTINNSNKNKKIRYLPSNHKFTNNDVILLTLQPKGSGDFFFIPPVVQSSSESIASTSSAGAVSVDARVLNMGPTYMDIVLSPGVFESTYGVPAPNDFSGDGDKSMRFRVDRFFSEIPYQRMVSALSQMTAVVTATTDKTVKGTSKQAPSSQSKASSNNDKAKMPSNGSAKSTSDNDDGKNNVFSMDPLFREIVLSTFAFSDPSSPLLNDPSICNVDSLSSKIASPPMGQLSHKLTNQVMHHMLQNPHGTFRPFNGPQRVAIEAALTRRFTMIQGPPGTGKTACAAAIGFGYVHQCRSLMPPSSSTTTKKVLACAFSNVGADNLAEGLLKLGLKVVRIGKPSAVAESLWNHTLEAAIDRDPKAQKAVQHAAQVTAQLSKQQSLVSSSKSNGKSFFKMSEQRLIRDSATLAVKASIDACNLAATKALREADVIVSTLTGASDPRLLAACGILPVADDDDAKSRNDRRSIGDGMSRRRKDGSETVSSSMKTTPDGLPPLSLPFVIVDEACQSVEPATLIPIVSTDSCRALVVLGDPCQLPPTVKSQEAAPYLSQSLMERLATTLHLSGVPQPKLQIDTNTLSLHMDDSYLNSRPMRQAVSLIQARSLREGADEASDRRSYRKQYNGSFFLSIQYRMHPSIAALPSAIFYNSLLTTPKFMADIRSFPDRLGRQLPCSDDSAQCVRFINVGGKNNERQGMLHSLTSSDAKYYYNSRRNQVSYSTSPSSLDREEKTTYWNEPEADRVVDLIKDVLGEERNVAGDSTNSINSIGVVTPYNGQVQLIKAKIAEDSELRVMLQKIPTVSIEVKSVDGYQGRERDIIIFSSVRSNRQQRIGFLHDWRRMNVALTRAKSALVIVGDLETLSAADKYWDSLAKWAEGVGCIINEDELPKNGKNQ